MTAAEPMEPTKTRDPVRCAVAERTLLVEHARAMLTALVTPRDANAGADGADSGSTMRQLDNAPPASMKWSKEKKEKYREKKRRERQQARGGLARTGLAMPSSRDPPTLAGCHPPMMATEELQLKPSLWVQAPRPPSTSRRGPVVYHQVDGRWVRQTATRSARPDVERPAQPVSYYTAARQRMEIGRQQRQMWSAEHKASLEEMWALKQQELAETRNLAATRRAARLSPREASALRREQQDQRNSARRAETGGRDWRAMQIASQQLEAHELKQKHRAARDIATSMRTAGSTASRSSRAVIYSEQKAKGFVLPPVYSPRKTAIVWSDHE
eukprot:COSAG02_NODE_816_length_16859_cov_15.645764_13_plen_328_part_00